MKVIRHPHPDSHSSLCFLRFRYTGSYNYGSYGSQHPPPMQSQYPALPHDTAISGPLHYAPYHRSSAQVSPQSCLLARPGLEALGDRSSQFNTVNRYLLYTTCVCHQGEGRILSSGSRPPFGGCPLKWVLGHCSGSTPSCHVGAHHLSLVPSSLIPGSSQPPCLLPCLRQPPTHGISVSHLAGVGPRRVLSGRSPGSILTGLWVSRLFLSSLIHTHNLTRRMFLK